MAAALGLSACASAVSTSSFHGEDRAVAQKVADLQSHVTASQQGKLCGSDLSSALVARLGGQAGCESALKTQLNEIDNTEATVQSVTIAPGGKTASATVKSVFEGKQRQSTLRLTKESAGWRISSLG